MNTLWLRDMNNIEGGTILKKHVYKCLTQSKFSISSQGILLKKVTFNLRQRRNWDNESVWDGEGRYRRQELPRSSGARLRGKLPKRKKRKNYRRECLILCMNQHKFCAKCKVLKYATDLKQQRKKSITYNWTIVYSRAQVSQ